MREISRSAVTRQRFDLLLPGTQRALCRNGIWDDKAVAALSDRDLRLIAYIGPVGREDIRRHFPIP